MSASPIALGTWYEFSFFDTSTPAMGCFPADPNAPECIPSSGTPTEFAGAPNWTFTAPASVVVTVTDAFTHGDAFDVMDFGTLIGATSTPAPADYVSCGGDPVPCLADPLTSKGFFVLDAGAHSLSILPYVSAYGAGSAYFRVDVVPEPNTWLLLSTGLVLYIFLRRRRALLHWGFKHLMWIFVTLALAAPASAQFAQLTVPGNKTFVSGTALLRAEQVMTSIDPNQVGSVQFQYSTDGVTWTLIDTNSLLGNSTLSQSALDWEVLWDSTQVPAGSYYLRARFYLNNGLIFTTPQITVTVQTLPVAVAKGTMSTSGLLLLDGSQSTAAGSIVSWEWDFGDGTTGSGETVSHSYAPGDYIVTLQVTDNQGLTAFAYLDASTLSAGDVPKAEKCIATKIQLRVEDAVLGKDGKGGGYPPLAGQVDGKTLGPLSKNPGNTRGFTGYAFEIAVNVDGDPAMCKEIQIVKGTYNSAANDPALGAAACGQQPGGTYNADNTCTFYSGWTGTSNDFDGDGTLDLDLSTKAKCEAQKGTWNGSTCVKAAFPQSETQYKPDESMQDKSAYRKPFAAKAHVEQKILWFDPPAVLGGRGGVKDGYTATIDFVAIIRGTDGKYCFDSFNVSYEVGKLEPKPTEAKNDCGVDKSKVPGLK